MSSYFYQRHSKVIYTSPHLNTIQSQFTHLRFILVLFLAIPNIPFLRNCQQEGCPLHSWPQHHQRKDLRDPLVLAGHPRLPDGHVLYLRGGHRGRARPAQQHGDQEGRLRQQTTGLRSRQQRSHWRLVHDLPRLTQHGFNHVS